ncbi:MAG: DegT/DnrJ/EryC1/StrS family aminotransferase [Planctomycetaceae bacterium]
MTNDRKFLPFALPDIGEEEIAEVVDTIRSGWLTSGPKTQKFEQQFAEYVGVKHAIAVSSATAALHLALEAIGVGPGDKVIVPVHTFTASAEVVRYLGADVYFVDVDAEHFCVDITAVAAALKSDPTIKAILPVHFGGQTCDTLALKALAEQHHVYLVEDAAHALPATNSGNVVGSIGDLTAFSFYATKCVATGEGGMVTTNNDAWAKRLRAMRLHGISSDVFDRYVSDKPKWYYEVIAPGFKYNMTDIAAAIGIHQLAKADLNQKKRAAIALRYQLAFADLPVVCPFERVTDDIHSWHLFVMQLSCDDHKERDQFIERMSEAGIGTSVHYIPLHLHPYWRDRYSLRPEDFPVSTKLFQRCVSLPIYPSMTEDDVQSVIDTVTRVLQTGYVSA